MRLLCVFASRLGESDRDGRIGREVELWISFPPVPGLVSMCEVWGRGLYLTTAMFTGAVVLAR